MRGLKWGGWYLMGFLNREREDLSLFFKQGQGEPSWSRDI